VHITGRATDTYNDYVLDAVTNGFTECIGKNYGEEGIWLEAGNHTFNLSSAWTGLESVSIHSSDFYGYMAIDNIVVSVVPIPAAVWLFGSGLGLLGWMRQKV
jgi:hypothetical protein